MHHPLRTVIVGAAGYTGAELASLLAAHPACEIVGVFGSEKRAAEREQPLSRLFPRLRGVVDLPQRVASVQAISEAHLLSVIEEMLAQFPFEILGFHADNGSEYVNHKVARLLEKLRELN